MNNLGMCMFKPYMGNKLFINGDINFVLPDWVISIPGWTYYILGNHIVQYKASASLGMVFSPCSCCAMLVTTSHLALNFSSDIPSRIIQIWSVLNIL